MENGNTGMEVIRLSVDPIEIICPSCNQLGVTIVRDEPATFCQRIYKVVRLCWTRTCFGCCKFDKNHYCCHCGCYIGRDMVPGYFKEKYLKDLQKKAYHC